jgi:hypothetical protein
MSVEIAIRKTPFAGTDFTTHSDSNDFDCKQP